MEKIKIGFFPRQTECMDDLTFYEIHEIMFNWYQHQLTCMVMTDRFCILCKYRDVEKLEALDKETLDSHILEYVEYECEEDLQFDEIQIQVPFGYYA